MPTLAELIDGEAATIEPHEPLSHAARVMYENRVGSLCVLDEADALVGIFTERDLLRACAAGIDTHQSTVGNWMTEDPMTATGDTDAETAMALMIDRDFRHLPVVAEGGLVGVVSMRRLSKALRASR